MYLQPYNESVLIKRTAHIQYLVYILLCLQAVIIYLLSEQQQSPVAAEERLRYPFINSDSVIVGFTYKEQFYLDTVACDSIIIKDNLLHIYTKE
jgi:cbb3-type cytochrome oxidase subunit 3